MVNLLKIGVQKTTPAQTESSETTAVASPPTPAPVSPSTTPAPSPSLSTAAPPSAKGTAVGLGAFLKAAQSGNPIKAPEAKLAAPPPPAFALTVPVVESRGPEGIKEKMQKLDALIGDALKVEQTDYDICRGYVAEISIELKTHPEYIGFVRAKDLHNIMLFIQASSSQAGNQFKVAAEKKEKATVRKTKASNFNLAAFGDDAPVQKGMNLKALSGINTDEIQAK